MTQPHSAEARCPGGMMKGQTKQGATPMEATIEDNVLTLKIKLNATPVLSGSGKTFHIADAGSRKLGVVHLGEPVTGNISITIPNREYKGAK